MSQALLDAEAAAREAGDASTLAAAQALVDTEADAREAGDDNTLAAAQAYADGPLAISTKSADYTLALGDAQSRVEVGSATAKTVTVPPNSSVAFPVGTTIEVAQTNAGAVTIAPGAGVSFTAPFGLTTGYQGSSIRLVKSATDSWYVENGGQLTTQLARVSGSNFQTTSGTLTTITGLSLPIGANEVWQFRAALTGQCSTASGVKFGFAALASAAVEAALLASNTSNTTNRFNRINALNTANANAVWAAIATDFYATLEGVFTTGATAGNLTLQALANTAGDTVTVYIGSSLRATRIA